MDTSGRRIDNSVLFEITEDHLKLVKRSFFHHRSDYDYYGAPGVGEKRPYGNSNVVGDIIEILGWNVERDWESGEWPKGVEEKALSIHIQMATVFQIASVTLKFETGMYAATDKYDNLSWKKVG
jgi:hypothetical protein